MRFRLVGGVIGAALLGLGACGGDSDDNHDGRAGSPAATVSLPAPTPTSTASPTPSSSPTPTVTPSSSLTPTVAPSGTATPTTTPAAQCGNGVLEGDEQCDGGGTCVGGTSDGATCPEAIDGVDCGAGECVAFGGDGCAANCTTEDVRMLMFDIGSHTTVSTGLFSVPIGITGTELWHTGKARPSETGGIGLDGEIPVAIRAEEILFDPVMVPGLLCGCVRGSVVSDFGPGNAGEGVMGCGPSGLAGVDVTCRVDHNIGVVGMDGFTEEDCAAAGGTLEGATDTHPNVCRGRLICTRSGRGPRGSAVVSVSSSVSLLADGGTCATEPGNPAKGDDGVPCTDDDPGRAAGSTAIFTTGTATAEIFDAGNVPNIIIGVGQICGSVPCMVSIHGTPADCDSLQADPDGGLGGIGLASAVPAVDVEQIGDYVVLTLLVGK